MCLMTANRLLVAMPATSVPGQNQVSRASAVLVRLDAVCNLAKSRWEQHLEHSGSHMRVHAGYLCSLP